ncbi:MAG: flagellar type III secretion system pore protein FliP [Pseudomonadota bacterium]
MSAISSDRAASAPRTLARDGTSPSAPAPARFAVSIELTVCAVLCGAVLCGTLWAGAAGAQSLTLDLGPPAGSEGEGATLSGRVIQLFLIVTVLSLAPGIAVMITCFPFMITVLSILRQGLGLQASPPNMLLVSLALFLTWFVMEPVFTEAWDDAIAPMLDGRVETEAAFERGIVPFRRFMAARVEAETLAELAAVAPGRPVGVAPAAETLDARTAPLSLLVPAFMLSEVARAFTIGFMLFLPFVIIDLVVASILMSMGMMMVPPVVVSLPLKLAFFVVADGWSLVAGALVRGYS